MRLIALAAASVLALSACSQGGEPEAAPPAAEPAPTLAGVDLTKPLRALGTEPFWSVELTGTELVYTSPEPPEHRATQPRPVVQGTTATWESKTAAGTAFSITLVATECSDGMSDRTYPLTAMVRIGETSLSGCAASAAAIMSAGESGPVVETQPAA
ncbi:MAG: hypothetical protein PSV23_14485 [Brevundimonas sp.]|uniref:COG3650 family protein n=1 Tax=Brevundimonas sp. TaxID=1871086 RepID=UPI00248A5956|nr:hypothetical protein [Brevundimonas sp.]MDI1327995.1 hypothetical protein [Brevundimonas sp.]